jgi:Heterokaryon incompatibility protein (HET)
MESTTTSPPTNDFYCEPLPDNQGHVRLLSLLPGPGKQTVCCELGQVRLYDLPEYEAISYCWGDLTDKVTIECNSVRIAVTKSFHGALRNFRYAARPRILWADAICIDQNNSQEKTHQVQLMREADGSGELPSLITRIKREEQAVSGARSTINNNHINSSEDTALKLVRTRLPHTDNPDGKPFDCS